MTPAPLFVPRRRPTTLLRLLLGLMAPLALWPGEPIRNAAVLPAPAGTLPCMGAACASTDRAGTAMLAGKRKETNADRPDTVAGQPETAASAAMRIALMALP